MSEINVQRVTTEDRTLPALAEADRLLEEIRRRAYAIFSGRGFGAGQALDDWLAAEREFNWPAAELAERDQEFVLSVVLPGFEPADVALTATPRELVVRARRQTRRTEEGKKGEPKLLFTEFSSADVCRRFELARPIDVDKVSATLRNGVLKVVAPKAGKSAKPVAAAA